MDVNYGGDETADCWMDKEIDIAAWGALFYVALLTRSIAPSVPRLIKSMPQCPNA